MFPKIGFQIINALLLTFLLLEIPSTRASIECYFCEDTEECKNNPSLVAGRCFTDIGCITAHGKGSSGKEKFIRACIQPAEKDCLKLQKDECRKLNLEDISNYVRCADSHEAEKSPKIIRPELIQSGDEELDTKKEFAAQQKLCVCSGKDRCNVHSFKQVEVTEKDLTGQQNTNGGKKEMGSATMASIVILALLQLL